MNTHLLLVQWSPCDSVGNAIFASLAILAFDALPGELLRLGLDLRVEQVDELALVILRGVLYIVVGEKPEQLSDGECVRIEVGLEVFAEGDDLRRVEARHVEGRARGRRGGRQPESGEARRRMEFVFRLRRVDVPTRHSR